MHPRDPNGRFASGHSGMRVRSNTTASRFGLTTADFDGGPAMVRSFPSSTAPEIGDDDLDALDQLRATEANYDGLGAWWGTPQAGDHYGGEQQLTITGRFLPSAALYEKPGNEGMVAPRDSAVLITAMAYTDNDGLAHQLPIPDGGLISRTSGITNDDPDVAAYLARPVKRR